MAWFIGHTLLTPHQITFPDCSFWSSSLGLNTENPVMAPNSVDFAFLSDTVVLSSVLSRSRVSRGSYGLHRDTVRQRSQKRIDRRQVQGVLVCSQQKLKHLMSL